MPFRSSFICTTCLLCIPASLWAQASVTSLADYKKKQDDGLAQSIQASQARARAGRLGMMSPAKGHAALAGRPAVIRLAHPPRQTGVDNRRGIVVR
jgi:hypothetical protein